MSDAWLPACTRGFLSAEIWTARRLEEQGVVPEHAFLIVVLPDGSEPWTMWSPTLDTVTSFVREMAPRSLAAHTAGHAHGEDADELIEQCRRGTLTH